MDTWVERLNSCSDSRERRAIVHRMEPFLEGLAEAENDILFPVLGKYLGFADWMQEARVHQCGIRELIQFVHATQDHEVVLEITDELAARLAQYLDGMHRILYPRLVQALNRSELMELRAKLGPYWIFQEISRSSPAAA